MITDDTKLRMFALKLAVEHGSPQTILEPGCVAERYYDWLKKGQTEAPVNPQGSGHAQNEQVPRKGGDPAKAK